MGADAGVEFDAPVGAGFDELVPGFRWGGVVVDEKGAPVRAARGVEVERAIGDRWVEDIAREDGGVRVVRSHPCAEGVEIDSGRVEPCGNQFDEIASDPGAEIDDGSAFAQGCSEAFGFVSRGDGGGAHLDPGVIAPEGLGSFGTELLDRACAGTGELDRGADEVGIELFAERGDLRDARVERGLREETGPFISGETGPELDARVGLWGDGIAHESGRRPFRNAARGSRQVRWLSSGSAGPCTGLRRGPRCSPLAPSRAW